MVCKSISGRCTIAGSRDPHLPPPLSACLRLSKFSNWSSFFSFCMLASRCRVRTRRFRFSSALGVSTTPLEAGGTATCANAAFFRACSLAFRRSSCFSFCSCCSFCIAPVLTPVGARTALGAGAGACLGTARGWAARCLFAKKSPQRHQSIWYAGVFHERHVNAHVARLIELSMSFTS